MLLKDRFADFLNEIEQIQKDNEKLNEDILALQKEKAEGYDKFNTETHILIERRVLEDVSQTLDGAYDECEGVRDQISSSIDNAQDAESDLGYARDSIAGATKEVVGLLKVEDEK